MGFGALTPHLLESTYKMSAKKRVKKAAGYRCEKCNAKPSNRSSLHAHHLIPESAGGETTEANLAALYDILLGVNGGLVDDFEGVFEEFVATGVRPELDLLSFGMGFGVTDGINKGAVEGFKMTTAAWTDHLTTKPGDDSQSGIVNPDTYWILGAIVADHGNVRKHVPRRIGSPPEELEEMLASRG